MVIMKEKSLPLLWTNLPEKAVRPLNWLHRGLQHILKPATRRRTHSSNFTLSQILFTRLSIRAKILMTESCKKRKKVPGTKIS